MNHLSSSRTILIVAFSWASTLGSFALAATPMAQSEYSAAKDVIAAKYKTEKAACTSQRSNAHDVCVQEAKGHERDSNALLSYERSGSTRDARKLAVTKADSVFAIAKERCDDLSGSAKTLCRSEAKDKHTNAIVDAKLVKTVSDAATKAIDEKRDADYKLASDKCDVLVGEARVSCSDTAKVRFNK